MLGEASEAVASGPPFLELLRGHPFRKCAYGFTLWNFTWVHESYNFQKLEFSAHEGNVCHIIWHIG